MTDGRMRVVWCSLVAGALILGSTLWLNCRGNQAPGEPAAPSGPSSGVNDSLYAFTSVATDPDGGSICYRFDWGDGDTSDWTGWVQSGQPGEASHSWHSSDAFVLRAQAKDTGGVVSAWSAGHQLNVALAWTKAIGGPYADFGVSVQQTTDSGYVVTGYTCPSGYPDLWLIKTDAHGNKTWDKTLGGADYDEGNSVQQTSDGGYIVAGYTQSYGAGATDLWLIKTDASGNAIWNKTIGGPSDDFGVSIQQTSDGGYIIAGYSAEVWLVKTDASGNKSWDKSFGGAGFEQSYSVRQTSDSGYIIAGYTTSFGAGEQDVWLVKTDAVGNKVWDKTFGGAGMDWGRSVEQTADGGYIVTGYTWSHSGNWDVLLIKTDTSGDEVWRRAFGGSDVEYGYSGRQTFDGGYIVAGHTLSYGAGSCDLWLVKTGANGECPASPDTAGQP